MKSIATVTIETEVGCATCGMHYITAHIHGATTNDVEIVKIQKGNMPEGLSLVYECGKNPTEDKYDVLKNFFRELEHMRPTHSLIKLVLLYHETGSAKPIKRILERCSYKMFFETMENCIKQNKISARRIPLSEAIWHPAKPQNEYRSAIIENFLLESILDRSATLETITGLLPILFAYYFPAIPQTVGKAIMQQIDQISHELSSELMRPSEQIVEESQQWIYYKLLNNMCLDHETICELGFLPAKKIHKKARIYETEQV